MYDLLLKGGEVLDPSAGLRGRLDVAVDSGRIALVVADLDASEARRVVDVSRGAHSGAPLLVAPGIIDIHCHVAVGLINFGIDPDLAGVQSGVCTVVDAGSCGSHTFEGLARYVAPRAATRVISMVHIVRTGLAIMPELRGPESLDPEGVIQTIEEHRGLAHGVKIRLVGPGVVELGDRAVREARRAARESGTLLMVHVGDTEGLLDPAVTRQSLDLLEPGDIVTHFFTAHRANLLDPGNRAWPEVADAMQRGVVMDCAHGRGNFSFDVAQRLLDQGLRPHCLSTDLTAPGRSAVVGSMTETMSKALALGFTLEEVIAMSTSNPARALGLADSLGSLAVGREADISVLEQMQGDFVFQDAAGGMLRGASGLQPVLTVRAGVPMPLDWGPRPAGWLQEAGG